MKANIISLFELVGVFLFTNICLHYLFICFLVIISSNSMIKWDCHSVVHL